MRCFEFVVYLQFWDDRNNISFIIHSSLKILIFCLWLALISLLVPYNQLALTIKKFKRHLILYHRWRQWGDNAKLWMTDVTQQCKFFNCNGLLLFLSIFFFIQWLWYDFESLPFSGTYRYFNHFSVFAFEDKTGTADNYFTFWFMRYIEARTQQERS